MNNENNSNNPSVLGSTNNPQNPIPTNSDINSGIAPEMLGNTLETLDSGLNNSSDISYTDNQNNNEVNQTPGDGIFFNNGSLNQSLDNDNIQNNPVNENVPGMNSQAVIEPMPSFTNPQTINPGPMPGFENPNSIGTTPPISLEPEKNPKKKSNKLLFILIVLVVLAAVGFGTFYVLSYTNILNNNASQIKIETKDLEVNVDDRLSANISDYATITGTAASNCSVNTLSVDITKIGTYEYTILCGETKKTGTIRVVDNAELEVAIKTVYKAKGESLEAKEFAKEENNNLTFEFIENDEVKNILNRETGTYTVKLRVSNKNNKTVELNANLVIVENPIKGYLTCSTNAQNISDINGTMIVKERFAISSVGTTNTYGGFAFEIHEFKINDETQYNNYIATYKTEKSITINNITGNDVSFDNNTRTITIINELDNDKIKNEYGASTFETYSSLSKYFKETLGYSCRYDR